MENKKRVNSNSTNLLPPKVLEFRKNLADTRLQDISRVDQNETIKIGPECEIAIADYDRIAELVEKKSIRGRQSCVNPAAAFAKEIYLFLHESSARPAEYWVELTLDKHLHAADLKQRKHLNAFFESRFKLNTAPILRDVGKQKRKNIKQRQERQKQQNRCKLCFAAFKNRRECDVHERKCHRKKDLSAPLKPNSRLSRCSVVNKTNKLEEEYQRKTLMSYAKGLEVKVIRGKGRGVVANRVFHKSDFVCEYKGELLQGKSAIKARHARYDTEITDVGSFMYEFQLHGKRLCIDATYNEDIGKLINHSVKRANIKAEAYDFNGPKLIFVAKKRIERCEELLYNYDDTDKNTLKLNPWLKI